MSEASKKMSRRDLIGTVVVDYDENVDIKRLCQERLAKLQAEMVNYDLGGMILFNPLNVRYATGVRGNEIIAMHMKLGYEALVPREGKPILFSITGLEPQVIDGLRRREGHGELRLLADGRLQPGGHQEVVADDQERPH